MKTLTVDGRCCRTPELTQEYLAKKTFFPTHYGKNLDALWDALTAYGRPIRIRVRYPASLERNLGEYGQKILAVFRQAAETNESITLEIG